jgi:putative transposase
VSRARPVYEGDTLFITRRVTQRMFLLRPSDEVNEIIGYFLAVLSAEKGIRCMP